MANLSYWSTAVDFARFEQLSAGEFAEVGK